VSTGAFKVVAGVATATVAYAGSVYRLADEAACKRFLRFPHRYVGMRVLSSRSYLCSLFCVPRTVSALVTFICVLCKRFLRFPHRYVGSANALLMFICILCTLRTLIARSTFNFTHYITNNNNNN
jgi:hypothetical protein